MNRFVCAFVKITALPVQFFCFRTKVHYHNKKSQSRKIKGSAIVISNHRSVYDFAVLMFVFFGRNLSCLMAEVLFTKNKLLAWFLSALGGIRVERSSHSFNFISKCCDILEKGGVVEIYPESRLPLPNEERPLPFAPSAAYIALRSGVPVIPVYTNGSYFNRKRCHVIIGEKIYPSALADPTLSEGENIEKITEYIRNAVMELGNELEKQLETK